MWAKFTRIPRTRLRSRSLISSCHPRRHPHTLPIVRWAKSLSLRRATSTPRTMLRPRPCLSDPLVRFLPFQKRRILQPCSRPRAGVPLARMVMFSPLVALLPHRHLSELPATMGYSLSNRTAQERGATSSEVSLLVMEWCGLPARLLASPPLPSPLSSLNQWPRRLRRHPLRLWSLEFPMTLTLL